MKSQPFLNGFLNRFLNSFGIDCDRSDRQGQCRRRNPAFLQICLSFHSRPVKQAKAIIMEYVLQANALNKSYDRYRSSGGHVDSFPSAGATGEYEYTEQEKALTILAELIAGFTNYWMIFFPAARCCRLQDRRPKARCVCRCIRCLSLQRPPAADAFSSAERT